MGRWRVVGVASRLVKRSVLCGMGLLAMVHVNATVAMTASMALSLVLYAWAFGLRFAIGLTVLLFVHELGHWFASRIVGLGVSRPLFVPFAGALIFLRQPPVNAKMEANIAIAGPAAGTLISLLFLAGYLWVDSTLVLVLAYAGCLLNLFNLIPCSPLDGGRIAGAISPRMWWSGSIVLAVLFAYTCNIFILIVLVFSLIRLWRDGMQAGGGEFYRLSIGQRVRVAGWYFGLLTVLGVATLYIMDLLR